MSKSIKFELVNRPFERRGNLPKGSTIFRDDRKYPKGGRAGEKVRFRKGME